MCRTIFFSMHRLYIVQRRNIRRFLRKFIQYVAYLNFSSHRAYELVKRLVFSLNYPPSFLRSAWYEPCIFNLLYLQWDLNPYKHFCSSDFLTTLAFTQANLVHSATHFTGTGVWHLFSKSLWSGLFYYLINCFEVRN